MLLLHGSHVRLDLLDCSPSGSRLAVGPHHFCVGCDFVCAVSGLPRKWSLLCPKVVPSPPTASCCPHMGAFWVVAPPWSSSASLSTPPLLISSAGQASLSLPPPPPHVHFFFGWALATGVPCVGVGVVPLLVLLVLLFLFLLLFLSLWVFFSLLLRSSAVWVSACFPPCHAAALLP